jgi:putative transposase
VLNLIRALLFAGLACLRTRRQLAVGLLALRHQLGVLKRPVKRPRLTTADRALWVLLSRRRARWNDALIIVKPSTVIRGHRAGFRRDWAWRSRPKGSRPGIDPDVRKLVERMAVANMWGAPRIHGKLLKLSIQVSEATVSKYMPRRRAFMPTERGLVTSAVTWTSQPAESASWQHDTSLRAASAESVCRACDRDPTPRAT